MERPDLNPCLEYVLDAFWTLSSDRAIGMGEGAIPFASIDRFAQRYGMDDLDSFDEFRSFIHAIDREYLSIRSDQADRDSGDQKRNRPV